MYQLFADRARKAMQLANQEAQRFNHEYIAPVRILIGLVRERTGVAATIFRNKNIDVRDVRSEVAKLVQSDPEMITMGKLPQTPHTKQALEYTA